MSTQNIKEAVFAGGCFWCTEAVFRRLKGVSDVISGYTGGARENPTYEEVSTGNTGYVEAIKISFDPSIISYITLLDVFWAIHDPISRDRQGQDIGAQYRSVIFYMDDRQKKEAEMSKVKVAKKYSSPIVTEILPFIKFYRAEEYHQEYFENNHSVPYCTIVINPKIQKLLKEFSQNVKDEYKNT